MDGVPGREERRDLHEGWRTIRGDDCEGREASVVKCGRHGGESGEDAERNDDARLSARQRREEWGNRRGGEASLGLTSTMRRKRVWRRQADACRMRRRQRRWQHGAREGDEVRECGRRR